MTVRKTLVPISFFVVLLAIVVIMKARQTLQFVRDKKVD